MSMVVLGHWLAVLVTWEDGHASLYDPVLLRRSCPCATCLDLRQKQDKRPKMGGLMMAQGPRPQEVAALGFSEVGNYAIAIRWQDGHDTGIYSYQLLRSLCPCEACAATP